MPVLPLEASVARGSRATSSLRLSAATLRRVVPTGKALNSGALQVLRAAGMFVLVRVALVARIPSGTTSLVGQAVRAAATVVLHQATSVAKARMVWISRWQQASSALDKGAKRTVVLASPAKTGTGRRSDAVPAQAAAETSASVQVAIVASTLMATTSCAPRAVVVLVTFALPSRKDDSMAC